MSHSESKRRDRTAQAAVSPQALRANGRHVKGSPHTVPKPGSRRGPRKSDTKRTAANGRCFVLASFCQTRWLARYCPAPPRGRGSNDLERLNPLSGLRTLPKRYGESYRPQRFALSQNGYGLGGKMMGVRIRVYGFPKPRVGVGIQRCACLWPSNPICRMGFNKHEITYVGGSSTNLPLPSTI